MEIESQNKSVALLFIGIFVFAAVLIAGIYLIKTFFFSPFKPLSPETFFSRLEEKNYYDEKLKKHVAYWVMATKNSSTATFYDCLFQITAKGTKEQFDGFFKDYIERDCRSLSQVKDNYDCRLQNWWKRAFTYKPARTLRKFNPNSSTEIPLSRFHQKETRTQTSFLTKNQLTDIHEYTISCKTSSGQKAAHSQIFE